MVLEREIQTKCGLQAISSLIALRLLTKVQKNMERKVEKRGKRMKI